MANPLLTCPMAARATASLMGPASRALVQAAHALHPFSPSSSLPILDIGSGSGETTAQLLSVQGSNLHSSTKVISTDISPAMVAVTTARRDAALSADPSTPEAKLWSRVQPQMADASDLSQFADGTFSHALAGFVIFFLPSPQVGLKEVHRVLSPGGVLSLTSWQGSDWMSLMDTFLEVRPETKLPFPRAEWRSTEGVKGELEKAGFKEVKAEYLTAEMPLDDYEDFVKFSFSWPALKDVVEQWSEEEREKLRSLCINRLKEGWPVLPATLKGTAIVGAGKK